MNTASSVELNGRTNWKVFYMPEASQSNLDPAREAFEEGKTILNKCLTRDNPKRDLLNSHHSIDDIRSVVSQAKDAYSKKREKGKAWRWLSAFSTRLLYYSPIMDTLAQHHPEYVSLAWGAVKFLFVAFLNQEELISTLAKALCRIAEYLPRQELVVNLYPTSQIKHGVAQLYAYIMKFLIRALKWYQEGTIMHMIHSVTRPVAIRYKDLLDDIEEHSRRVDRWAAAAAQAELRDIHGSQADLQKDTQNLYALTQGNAAQLADVMKILLPIAPRLTQILSNQALQSSALLNTNQRLFDLQIAQMLEFATRAPTIDPEANLAFGTFMRNRRRLLHNVPNEVWHSPRFRNWSECCSSSVVLVKGSFASRFKARDLGVTVVEALRAASKYVLFVLQDQQRERKSQTTAVDLIKSLVFQAIRINENFRTIKACTVTCARVGSATTESDWMDILLALLSGLPVVYIVFDVESLSQHLPVRENGFSWPLAFFSLFQKLASRGCTTVVKVLFISYGNAKYTQMPADVRPQDVTVMINATKKQDLHAKKHLAFRGRAGRDELFLTRFLPKAR